MHMRDVARGGDGLCANLYFYYCHTNHYYYSRGLRPLGGDGLCANLYFCYCHTNHY